MSFGTWGWKKPQMCLVMSKDVPLGKEHGFAPAYIYVYAQFAEASKWHSKSVHLPDRSVINLI